VNGPSQRRQSPRLQAQETDYGFRYAALRRPIQNAATSDYVRVTLFVAPFNVLIPPNNVDNVHQMSVPATTLGRSGALCIACRVHTKRAASACTA
jgi:hypothetical protein